MMPFQQGMPAPCRRELFVITTPEVARPGNVGGLNILCIFLQAYLRSITEYTARPLILNLKNSVSPWWVKCSLLDRSN